MRVPKSFAYLLFLCAGTGAHAQASPASTAQSLCDSLMAAMKEGPSTSFDAREKELAPEIRKDLDLAAMTRIVVGPAWKAFTADQKEAVAAAFSDYSIANYAQRFKSYSGEHFVVEPASTALPGGDCVVHTRLYTGDPDPVRLDYMMRLREGHWRIIDVFLNGTISELAARRSEYSLVLRTGGPAALVDLLRKKTEELSR
jgi:phospholipid transport system substrate-binding protein